MIQTSSLNLKPLLAAEGPQTDIIQGAVHLVRDKTKKVTAVWIQWQEAQNFFEARRRRSRLCARSCT